MIEKKKMKRVRIVKPNSINYTFTDDLSIHSQINGTQQNKKTKEKTRDLTRKALKDLNTKTHYKPSRSPKSQQAHSSVYE